MLCVMSARFTFFLWIQMAAGLLSVGLSDKGLLFFPAASCLTRQPLWQSSCSGIRMKLWKYLLYSLAIMVYTLILFNSMWCLNVMWQEEVLLTTGTNIKILHLVLGASCEFPPQKADVYSHVWPHGAFAIYGCFGFPSFEISLREF